MKFIEVSSENTVITINVDHIVSFGPVVIKNEPPKTAVVLSNLKDQLFIIDCPCHEFSHRLQHLLYDSYLNKQPISQLPDPNVVLY